MTSTGAIDNAGGKLVAAQDASLTGTSLGNQGGTLSARNLAEHGAGALDNTMRHGVRRRGRLPRGSLVNHGGTLAAVGT